MRYWLYKVNVDGGPVTDGGDWLGDVFQQKKSVRWGGSATTASPESARYFLDDVSRGDVVVCYQTNETAVVGFCLVTRVEMASGDAWVWLKPLARLPVPFYIHKHKKGTALARSAAVNGPVALRELNKAEFAAIVSLSGAPVSVLPQP